MVSFLENMLGSKSKTILKNNNKNQKTLFGIEFF